DQHRNDHRHFAGRPRSRRLGSGRRRIPRLHGDPRIEPGDSMMRTPIAFAVLMILLAHSPAQAQSWEASGLFGFTPSASIDQRASELTDADIRGGFTWGLQGARFLTPSLGAEVLWT